MSSAEKAALRGQLLRLFLLLEDAGPLEVAAARSRLLALKVSLTKLCALLNGGLTKRVMGISSSKSPTTSNTGRSCR